MTAGTTLEAAPGLVKRAGQILPRWRESLFAFFPFFNSHAKFVVAVAAASKLVNFLESIISRRARFEEEDER